MLGIASFITYAEYEHGNAKIPTYKNFLQN